MSIIYRGGETKKYDQGDYTFAIRPFPAFHSMRVLGDLQKVVVPALGGAVGGLKPESLDMDTSDVKFIGGAVADALNNLAKTLDGETLERAAELLLDPQYVSVAPLHTKDFQPLDEGAVNEIFSGRIIDLIALMVQIFKVNYADFSKLSSVPTGVRKALGEIKSSFLASSQTNSPA